ncbi:MAG TPA: hypothetical protein VJ201_04140 [Candidatus Babeliales bacterium]|nr:hypothetical protein [Candidatus Babeliales bacterium]
MKRFFLLIAFLGCIGNMYSFAPITFFEPWNTNLRTPVWRQSDGSYVPFKVGVNFESGSTSDSHNFRGESSELGALYHDAEDTLAMLLGELRTPEIAAVADDDIFFELLTVDPDPDRGKVRFNGRFEGYNFNLFAQYYFDFCDIPGLFDIGVYLPIVSREIKYVRMLDLTKNVTTLDRTIRLRITMRAKELAQKLGNLEVGDFKKSGIGDLAVIFAWHHEYPQFRKQIENVRLTARVGVTFPTAGGKDEDKVFSMPLGHDGAYTVPASLGLDIFFGRGFKLGGEFELHKWFDTTRNRRMKTLRDQTDLLLLTKGQARKKYGSTWKINLYGELEHIVWGLSIKTSYEFLNHGEAHIFPKSNKFNEGIVNSARQLHDWTYQSVIFQLGYDTVCSYPNACIKPQVSFFWKVPVGQGRRIIDTTTVGVNCVFNF